MNTAEAITNGARQAKGSNRECKYYPCHFSGQDCTWCYCPFYPCMEEATGGQRKLSNKSGREVWSCKNCTWIHLPRNAERLFVGMHSNSAVSMGAGVHSR